MVEAIAKIEIINRKVFITPEDKYDEIEKFFWDNKEQSINEIFVLPF